MEPLFCRQEGAAGGFYIKKSWKDPAGMKKEVEEDMGQGERPSFAHVAPWACFSCREKGMQGMGQ